MKPKPSSCIVVCIGEGDSNADRTRESRRDAAVIVALLLLWLMRGGITSDGQNVTVDLPNVTVTR